MMIECKVKVIETEELIARLKSVRDERIARNAYDSWKKSKETILSEIKESYGKLPENKDQLMALIYAAGYRNATLEKEETQK